MTKSTKTPPTSVDIESLKSAFGVSTSAFGKLGELSKKNAEAAAAATSAVAQGAQALCAQSLAFSKATAESNFAAAVALAGAKSPQEAIALQTEHLQASIARLVGEISKVSETYSSSFNRAAAPLRERVSAVLEAAKPAA